MQAIVQLTSQAKTDSVKQSLVALGCWVEVFNHCQNEMPSLVVKLGANRPSLESIRQLDGVSAVLEPNSPCRLVERQAGVKAFDGGLSIIAGPCAVESPERLDDIASSLKSLGIGWLRGGAYKPRTSPYSFQGHGHDGLKWLGEVSRKYDLSVVTEVMSELDVDAVAQVATWLQVGARNMQNFSLLKRVGSVGKPVLLKRGPAALIDEWLAAGEYLLAAGASRVIFCERGVRGLPGPTRNTLDLATVVHMRETLGQPVIVDPSHATGRRDLVVPMSKAALVSGADGIMIEVHPEPASALSDGAQALGLEALDSLVRWVEKTDWT